ncbi:MAG TPA: tetratricopeptide repeat protein [Geobacteraceae bacterium]
MERDTTSFLADIKKYEDTLAKDPGSYCFAPLAELYRKLGLLDDAIAAAKRGCEIHPDYVGGHMALGRACFEKGLKDESRGALEKVVSLTPDNLLALRLLSHLYAEQGDTAAAVRVLQQILSQSPGDMESQAMLDSLKDALPAGPQSAMNITGEDEGGFPLDSGMDILDSLAEYEIDLDDAEIIEELGDDDLLEEDEFIVSPAKAASTVAGADVFAGEKSPISTVTLAELYVSQGFSKRALTIYRELLETDPDNAELKRRLYELKKAIDEDTAIARGILPAGDETVPEVAETSGVEDRCKPEEAEPPLAGGDDRVLATLEKWLDTIKRRQ